MLIFFLQFEPAEAPIEGEKKASLALLSRLESDAKKIRKEPAGDSILNVRKAVRFASKGRGAIALGKDSTARTSKGAKGRRELGGKRKH